MTKRKSLWKQLALLLAVIGPGIVTGSVDNDAGGITTYSVAGSLHGFNMLWTLGPAFLVLLAVQEMNSRMGLATGKGLADLIRENAGVKITFFLFAALFVADVGNTTTEFAGIAGSSEILGISKYLSVPLVAVLVWFVVVKGTYKSAERLFLVFSTFLLSYVVSALMANPDWHQIGSALIHPKVDWNRGAVELVVGLIGTTVAPWMMFYMQSAVTEKGLTMKDYKFTLIDVTFGCLLTVVVAFFIMVACGSTLHVHGIHIEKAADAARALEPLAGRFAALVFSLGLFVASFFSACILPVASSFYICEAFGFEAGIDKSWKEAPQFYTLFTAILGLGALVIMIPGIPLVRITILTQVLNGLLLPLVLIAMMILSGNRDVMGEHANGKATSIVGWATTAVLSLLSLFLIVATILG